VLTIENISPRKVELPRSGMPFCKISSRTPERPMARPVPLRNVILSLRINAAKMNAKIGFVESIIEEFIGVVMFSPTRNNVWLITTPKNEHTNRYSRSFLLTGSLGIKRLVNQKSAAAEMLRNATRAKGFICSGITAFAIEKLSP
jgi:hypothetical protein